MHLTRLFEIRILQVKITVIRTGRIVLRCFNNVPTTNNERQTRHSHQALLGGCHAKIDIVFHHVKRNHTETGCSVADKDCPILVGKGTNLADGIQNTCPCFVMTAIYYSHIGILFQALFNICQIRLFKYARLKVNVRNVIHLTHLNCACVVCTIVHHQNLFAFRNQ